MNISFTNYLKSISLISSVPIIYWTTNEVFAYPKDFYIPNSIINLISQQNSSCVIYEINTFCFWGIIKNADCKMKLDN